MVVGFANLFVLEFELQLKKRWFNLIILKNLIYLLYFAYNIMNMVSIYH